MGATVASAAVKPSRKRKALSGFLLDLSHRVESGIPGLTYYRNVLTEAAAQTLIAEVDNGTWSTELKRRVQHFGFTYDIGAELLRMTPTLAHCHRG